MTKYDLPDELRKGLENRRLKIVSDQHKMDRGVFMEKILKVCEWIGETEGRHAKRYKN